MAGLSVDFLQRGRDVLPWLGAEFEPVAAGATNGAAVLHAYVQHTFGSLGSGFLAIARACWLVLA